MTNELTWHAVYTRPKWEQKVNDLLSRKNLESYCPMNRTVRQWADRRKTIYTPLFRSYVFVKVSNADYLSIQKTDGILNFVYWLGKPAIIKEDEINAIKLFMATHADIKLESTSVMESDKIRIIDGPFIYMEGSVVQVKSQTVKVNLPSLGCVLSAEIPKTNIEIIHKQAATTKLSS